MKKAIFFDRDGTLIVDKNYLSSPGDIEYFPEFYESMKKIQEKGYDLFIVTNQSGVGRGYFKLDDVNDIHTKMQRDMKDMRLTPFKDFAVCPHHPDEGCECRKPNGKLITELVKKYEIDPTQSFMIGDKLSDAQAGENAGLKSYLIRSDSETDDFKKLKNLLEVAHLV